MTRTPPLGDLVIRGARVLRDDGRFGAPSVVRTRGGVFVASEEESDASSVSSAASRGDDAAARPLEVDGSGMWLIPGVHDVHCHIAWNDFHDHERERRSPEEADALVAAGLEATLRAGVTALRDAGGADARLRDRVAGGELRGPRLQVAIELIGPAQAGSAERMRAAVGAALDRGADWIKLMATAGAASESQRVLDPLLSREEIELAVRLAESAGTGVMVHSWGGESLDWSVAAGVRSIEHGIHLTEAQAERMAAAGTTFVPTLAVYRQLLASVRAGTITGVPEDRVADAVERHGLAVQRALEHGVPLALGSDYGTARQHGRNLAELAALIEAGVPAPDALLAATRNGAVLMRTGAGCIAAGLPADAVLLRADPARAATFVAPDSVAGVVHAGEWLPGTAR